MKTHGSNSSSTVLMRLDDPRGGANRPTGGRELRSTPDARLYRYWERRRAPVLDLSPQVIALLDSSFSL